MDVPIVYCSVCNAEMYNFEQLTNTKPKNGKSNNGFKRFRYECDICDRTELRYTEFRITDTHTFLKSTEKAVEKMYKEQTENN